MYITVSKSIQEYIRKIKSVFESNKVTFTLVILCTVGEAGVAAIPYEYYQNINSFVDMILRVLLYLIIPSLFIETYFAESKVKCVCGYIIVFIFSGMVAACGELYIFSINKELPANIQQIVGPEGIVVKDYARRFMCGILLMLSVAIVYKSFKKTELCFGEYVTRVFHNVIKSMAIWFVLKLCSVLVDSVMAHTFLRRYYFEYDIQIAGEILIMNFWRGPVEVLAMGLYFGSKMILLLKDMGEEPGKITRTIMKYILPTFTISAIAIVYLYILNIVFLTQIPSNEVFSIVSKLFCLCLPAWIIAGYYYTDNTKPMMIISILPYLFIPLNCLQGYCMGVRIYQYGMTPARYAGMMLIVFEIGTLFIHFYMKGQYEKLLPFFGLLVLIAVFVPGINMNKASNLWQMSFLKKYYQAVESGEMISKLAYERMTGAYDYLRCRPEMQAAIEPYDIYEKTFIVKLKEHYSEADLTKYDKCWVFCELAEELDADGYSQKSMLNQNNCYDKEGEDGIEVDFSCFQFIDSETGEKITVDISSFVEQCMADTLDDECTEMKAYNCIDLGDDTILYINRFDVEYFDGIKNAEPFIKWRYIDINGIRLQNIRDRKPMMYFWRKTEVLWARS